MRALWYFFSQPKVSGVFDGKTGRAGVIYRISSARLSAIRAAASCTEALARWA